MLASRHLLFTALALPAAPALAQEAPAPICTDRPTRANAVCTVPAGAVQLEADAVNWTVTTLGDARTDVVLWTNPTLKLGLGPRTDVQIAIAPHATARTRAGGSVTRVSGVGDLFVRVKQRLTRDGAPVQVGLIPFVKAPTARRGIGNRAWEGGVALPVVFALPSGFTLNLGPEIDLLADGDGRGRHAQYVGVANLSRSVGPATLYAELWTARNDDPAGVVRQYSADVAVAYLVSPRWQLDVGANLGLNRQTPDAQLYAGVSTRF